MKRSNAAQLQHKFDADEVLYLTGDVNYSTVYLLNGKTILTSRTLKWYTERWPTFLRIHKAYLVNPIHIYSCVVVSSEEAHLTMRNGARLSISRRRIWEVIDQLEFDLAESSFRGKHNARRGLFIPSRTQVPSNRSYAELA